MFDETNNPPQPTDPPTGTGGGGNLAGDLEDPETADAQATDPPTGTGGGGS